MKKKILTTILIILIVLAIALTLLKITNNSPKTPTNKLNEEEITNTNNDRPTLTNIKIINICKDKNNCPIQLETTLGDLTFDFDDENIQNWINQINKETEQYYQESINSTLDDEECQDVKDIYNYKILNTNYYKNYIGNKYISLSVQRMSLNVCTNEATTTKTQTFLYNKETKKQITQEELKQELNLTEDSIKKIIQTHIKNWAETPITTEIPANIDYSLYFDLYGSLLVEYYLETTNTYYTTTVLY